MRKIKMNTSIKENDRVSIQISLVFALNSPMPYDSNMRQ